jgi:hypothetical protein
MNHLPLLASRAKDHDIADANIPALIGLHLQDVAGFEGGIHAGAHVGYLERACHFSSPSFGPLKHPQSLNKIHISFAS